MYKITRTYRDFPSRRQTIASGLSLAEAQAHQRNPESSSRTCTSYAGKRRTQRYGPWFDGCEEIYNGCPVEAIYQSEDLRSRSIALVRTIAGLTKDGEEIDGVEWDMPNDDAVDTLHRLISDAREIFA